MSTMTKTVDTAVAAPDVRPLKERAIRLAKKISLFIPAAIVFALIALYYIQLSHMGPM